MSFVHDKTLYWNGIAAKSFLTEFGIDVSARQLFTVQPLHQAVFSADYFVLNLARLETAWLL
jgi:hypothetical protein